MPMTLRYLLPMIIIAVQAVMGADGMRLRACHGSLGFSGEHDHDCAGHGNSGHRDSGQDDSAQESSQPATATAGLGVQIEPADNDELPAGPQLEASDDDCVLFAVRGSRHNIPSLEAPPVPPPATWIAVATVELQAPPACALDVDSPRGPPDGPARVSALGAGALPLRL